MKNHRLYWINYLKGHRIYLYGLEAILDTIIQNIKLKENNISCYKISKKLSIHPRTFYYWLKGKRPIILNKFLELIELSDYTIENIFDDIRNNLKGISSGSGHRNKLVKFPFYLNDELAYLVGYLFGDGCLKSTGWTITFVDEYYEQIKNINNYITSLFRIKGSIIKKENKTELIIYSKALLLFFNKIFEMPIGKKKELKIPTLVKSSKFQFSFVKGFSDADGGICRIEEYNKLPCWFDKGPQIEISSKSKNILKDLKSALEDYNLKPNLYFHKNNNSYRLIFSGKRKILECQKMGIFNHPIKKMRLNKIASCLSGSAW